MEKTTQDLAWACLPKEAREAIVKRYIKSVNMGLRISLCELFGEHNLTSDTEPEEMLTVERKRVQELYDGLLNEKKAVSISTPYGGTVTARLQMLQELFGDKCLPDKPINGAIGTTSPSYRLNVEPDTPNTPNSGELKLQSVEGQPKFKVGDKVRIIIEEWQRDPISEVISYDAGDNTYKLDALDCEGGGLWVKEWQIEPYTEPETKRKETQNLSLSDKQITDIMEEKELNLAELLKGCEGEKIFSTFEGDMTIVSVTDSNIVLHGHNTDLHCGKGFYPSGICQLYPSRALYEKYPLDPVKAWEVWASERKSKYNVKVIIECWQDNDDNPQTKTFGATYSSKEEAQQAAEAVRKTLLKIHEQNEK